MIKVQIKTSLKCLDPLNMIIEKNHISKDDIKSYEIIHRSIDLRAGQKPHYLYSVSLDLKNEEKYLKKHKDFLRYQKLDYIPPKLGELSLKNKIIVVGFGPSGMAAALYLSRMGYCPLVIERGSNIVERKEKVDSYWNGGTLDSNTNVQFGEGGAGAFSDGKLTTRIKDQRINLVLNNLVALGADHAIKYLNHPHLGTDTLYKINQNLRNEIIKFGGSISFNTTLEDIIVKDNQIVGIIANGKRIDCSALILCIGHSAIDTIKMLNDRGILMESKPFAVGFRIEHSQEYINRTQYRNIESEIKLPNAEYYLTHTAKTGKGVYSFCMCPGGYVVPSESEQKTIVTNGMSYSTRDGNNANSAILVQVDSTDYGNDIFSGLQFQQDLEKKTYFLGEGKAPIQKVSNYLNNSKDENISIIPTYSRGTIEKNLHNLLDSKLDSSIVEMLKETEKRMPGFTKNSLLTAIESKSSCPIRIIRDRTTLESNIKNIYPCGEGSGYSGGIVSSAIDGIKCAEKIIEKYSPR